MGFSSTSIFGICALVFALLCGYSLGRFFYAHRQDAAYKKTISKEGLENESYGLKSSTSEKRGFNEHMVDYMCKLTKRLELKKARRIAPIRRFSSQELENDIRLAGIQGQVSVEAFYETKVRAFLLMGLSGGIIGFIFSAELACVLAVTGAFFGAQLPKHVLKNRIATRTQETERHLPEMLEVIALCMRSGLSLDASISIYAKHFDTMLSREMESARRKWSSGLERRDEALKSLASTYDSVILSRVIDTIIRSVRFGSSMVASLENDASEARSAFRSAREERIAKAPVKMMIPTGVLILPAMLIMVLGPVLLEMMEGGI